MSPISKLITWCMCNQNNIITIIIIFEGDSCHRSVESEDFRGENLHRMLDHAVTWVGVACPNFMEKTFTMWLDIREMFLPLAVMVFRLNVNLKYYFIIVPWPYKL